MREPGSHRNGACIAPTPTTRRTEASVGDDTATWSQPDQCMSPALQGRQRLAPATGTRLQGRECVVCWPLSQKLLQAGTLEPPSCPPSCSLLPPSPSSPPFTFPSPPPTPPRHPERGRSLSAAVRSRLRPRRRDHGPHYRSDLVSLPGILRDCPINQRGHRYEGTCRTGGL